MFVMYKTGGCLASLQRRLSYLRQSSSEGRKLQLLGFVYTGELLVNTYACIHCQKSYWDWRKALPFLGLTCMGKLLPIAHGSDALSLDIDISL